MSFNSLGQYVGNHKAWDHVGNAYPDMEVMEGFRVSGFKPAAWLPVQFYDKHFDDWIVCMNGKVLALDNDGRLVPAQYGLAAATITYTSSDVDAGTIDVRTGKALLTAAIGTFNVSDVSSFMGAYTADRGAMSVSKPVGVAPYPLWQWAGDGSSGDDGTNPAYFRHHNYNLQSGAALLCDYVLELPVVPAKATSEALEQDSYDSSGYVKLGPINNLPVAKNTTRTPLTFANNSLTDAATRFVNEVATLANVTGAGDYYVDYVNGYVYAFASSDPSGGATAYSLTYFHYAANASGTSVSKFASVVGNPQPGDFLVANSDSNLQVWAGTEDFTDIVAQALTVHSHPRGGLDKVRTAYSSLNTSATGSLPGTLGQMDQMPGTANGGYPASIHYSGAANLVVRVNLVSR